MVEEHSHHQHHFRLLLQVINHRHQISSLQILLIQLEVLNMFLILAITHHLFSLQITLLLVTHQQAKQAHLMLVLTLTLLNIRVHSVQELNLLLTHHHLSLNSTLQVIRAHTAKIQHHQVHTIVRNHLTWVVLHNLHNT